MPRTHRLRVVSDEGASRKRILDTAAELLARYGYEGMSMQMLADQVGLHKSTLFHHFSGKEELTHQVLNAEIEELVEVLSPLASGDSPSMDQFVMISEEIVTHFVEKKWAGLLLLRSILGPDNIQHGEGQEPVIQLFTILGSWLDRARKAGVIRQVRVRHALVNLLGLVLFYPAIAEDELCKGLLGGDPSSSHSITARKEELAAFLRGAFAP